MKLTRTQILSSLLIASMITVMSCGGNDDDGDTTIIVNPDGQQREEEGPISTSPTIIINNRIENNVKIRNNRTRIVRNNYIFRWTVINVDQVIHPQYIHVANQCPTSQNDLNGDGYIDQVEVQQVVGPAVLALDLDPQNTEEIIFPSGTSFDYSATITLDTLRRVVPQGQDFVVILYGVSPSTPLPATIATTTGAPVHETIPVACQVFRAPEITTTPDDGSTTTGTTGTGTTTTGTTGTGTTTSGTSGSGTTTGGSTTGGGTTGTTTNGTTGTTTNGTTGTTTNGTTGTTTNGTNGTTTNGTNGTTTNGTTGA